MAKTLTLPPRDEGPHSWLGRLIREDAERRLSGGRDRATSVPELTQTEWEWLSRGWCWLRSNRSGLTFDRPNRYLARIVDRHAKKHLAVSRELDKKQPADHPARVEKAARPAAERLEALRAAIWAHLIHGFCRILDDGDEIVWWHLLKEEFVPFDAAYNLEYSEWQLMYRGISGAIQSPDNRPYLGRRQSRYDLDE